MADDCSNNWGCNLAQTNTNVPQSRSRRMCTVGDNCSFSKMAKLVDATFHDEYQLQKVVSCGSDANLHAILELTKGDNNCCLIAAGSYVSGDGSPLQSWSTSSFSMDSGPAMITHPDQIMSKFTKSHTIGLPYSIPGTVSENALRAYEDKCITSLHNRCILAKLKGLPIRCLLLELILASNGASLSDRSLVAIGKLAEIHNMFIVVDEIMTGGRTGTMLLLQTKPPEFKTCVSHVTLGKWIKVGLLLASKLYIDVQKTCTEKQSMTKRGVSTFIANDDIIHNWNAVQSNLKGTESRRSKVLAKKNINPNDAWGKGCLIFGPIHKQGMIYGLKNRLLPLLNENTPIDSFVSTKMPGWSKEEVNKITMEGVEQWIEFIPNDDSDGHLYELVKFLTSCKNHRIHEFNTMAKNQFPTLSGRKLSGMLRKAEQSGLVVHELVGAKRVRRWKVSGWCFPSCISS